MKLASLVIALILLAFGGNVNGIYPEHHAEYQPMPKEGKCTTVQVMCPADDTYQTFDGSCNNMKHPTWGTVGTPHPRLLPPEYDDKKGSPRIHESKRKLPSTRRVSNVLKDANPNFSPTVSHMHVLFGQLLAHDIVHTPVVKNSDGSKLDCNCKSPHEECFNIMIDENDEQYIQANKTCFGLARSKPAEGLNGCEFPHREQTSALSSVIDGTFVYGKSEKESWELRNPFSNSGELKTKENPIGGPHKLLPTQSMLPGTTASETTDCPMKVHKPVDVPCFVAGDIRNNENTGLASIQTIWMRYHNKIARDLKTVNMHWSSDKVYSETRRIIAAKMQIITYNEYVPLLLGPLWTKRMDLGLSQTGYWNGYDDQYDPSITNEFTTAAFRYGHSQVAATLTRPNEFFQRGFHPDVKSEDSWFNSEPLLNMTGGGVGSLMRGFMVDRAENTDPTLTDALRNQLFTEFGDKFGGDLFAINTQRGRDHGFPGYNEYRELCGLSRVRSLPKLKTEIPLPTIIKLLSVYDHVDDIDLYAGGLAENHVPGGEVGPTFACILAHGFRALRKGDRYWHEHEFSPYPFTPRQLSELRKITFAKLLCDTGDDMRFVKKSPMKIRSGFDSCAGLPSFDISAWKDGASGELLHGSRAPEVEWTAWFVTDATHEDALDMRAILERLKTRRPNEIPRYDQRMNYAIRRVPGDPYLQIQFSCLPGSITATDFPPELSDQAYWTEWVVSKSKGFSGDQEFDVNDFYCKAIAIQARTIEGDLFARETGDVFEDNDASRGFVCRDRHQPQGRCQRYKVRALCPRARFPSSEIGRYKRISTLYCHEFGVCCDFGIPFGRRHVVPEPALDYAKTMCSAYHICCDY